MADAKSSFHVGEKPTPKKKKWKKKEKPNLISNPSPLPRLPYFRTFDRIIKNYSFLEKKYVRLILNWTLFEFGDL